MTTLFSDFGMQVSSRLRAIDEDARSGGLARAIEVIADAIEGDGVLHAFGTGHSEAFAMEIAGRAGGFIPSHAIALRDLVLLGGRGDASILVGAQLERDESIVDELYDLYEIHPADAFLIASNSGVNGSVVGLALRAKTEGHPVIAVTSLEHSNAVQPKHPSGKRLSEVADVVLDNRAPYGDATLDLGDGLGAGPVSSITAAYIAQLLTIGAAERIRAAGHLPPLYISANIPGGDEHNDALERRYGARIKPTGAPQPAAARSVRGLGRHGHTTANNSDPGRQTSRIER
ncbi:SIS domain-containing protein [Micromonospora sp. WMMD1102]|uniref:SIS domain-containing protein n=1 Tax=Micromonospora sp. WMMD1102 TaxID=3016105 RepID=UPI002415293E|nr:SIS domain-containing protein [Micromonospora sp. WMMD1102]MDG4791737.1 SIS domain-containing protein [Micromonospora sp. WMMD1102]